MFSPLEEKSNTRDETVRHSRLRRLPLLRDWRFRRLGVDIPAWVAVELPHSPFVADLDGRNHWFGVCEYQRVVQLPPDLLVGRCALYLGAAMHTAQILVDGFERGRHAGGYLPFEVDLTAVLGDGLEHTLTVRLDNRESPDVPPGKPYAELDFCWYGGLYRDAELRCYPLLHVTAPAGAGGGILVRTIAADPESAMVGVRVQMANADTVAADFRVEVELCCGETVVAVAYTSPMGLQPATSLQTELRLRIPQPRLWSVESPVLHRARVTLRGPAGEVLDVREERFGIRRISFSRSGGFVLNGRRLRLRGTNRHQDYPHAGYAVPAAAQRRDARLIKEAGFDYVRCSHYPPAPEFLDACDELGLVVMDAIPGWQHLGGESFRAACRENARALIRRDRNHPCVVLWELSLNETQMDDAFMDQLHAIGHEELPGDQMFTCGWIDRYDVFIHSRQHRQIHTWRNGDKAHVVAEYGDWEFYAANEGFDQKTGAGVLPREGNSRQLRANGERGLRRQLENHILALNDTLGSPAVLDGQWAMFDYARGYDPARAACGIMDIFRLPKFSYWFYRSQRAPTEDGGAAWSGGPIVYIASHWTPKSALRVLVLGNCDEVGLSLNGVTCGRRKPERILQMTHLPHPPVIFELPSFVPGVLEATGFIAGSPVAVHRVATPGAPVRLEWQVALASECARPGGPDLWLAHVRVLDHAGMLCQQAELPVAIVVEGGAVLLAEPTNEAGIWSMALRVPADCGWLSLRATSPGLTPAQWEWSVSTHPGAAKKRDLGDAAVMIIEGVP